MCIEEKQSGHFILENEVFDNLTRELFPEYCECGDKALPHTDMCEHCWKERMGLL